MKNFIKMPMLIISFLMASLSFGQLTQSISLPMQGKTIHFDPQNSGGITHFTDLPIPNPSDYPLIGPDDLNSSDNPLYVEKTVTNERGELLFFIKDQRVYDYRGISLDNDGYSFEFAESVNIRKLDIVPLDGDCYKYLLVWHEVVPDGIAGGGAFNKYYYNTLYVNGDRTLSFGASDPTLFYEYTDGSNPNNDDFPNGFAISKIKSNGKRFLFLHSHDYEYTFEITGSGLNHTPISSSVYANSPINYTEGRLFLEESEVIEKNGNYYYVFASGGSHSSKIALVFIKYNSNGQKVFQTYKDIGYSFHLEQHVNEYIKGIEFSEDGNYLYFTQRSKPMQYLSTDFMINETTPGVVNTVSSIGTDYQYSQIELGRDKRFYLINGTTGTLTAVANTNTPSNLIITTNIGQSNGISGLQISSNYSIISNNIDLMKHYYITSQVDGSDYTSYYTSLPLSCCSDHFPYNVGSNYTVPSGTVATWTPSNNPFGSGGETDIYFRDNLTVDANANITISGLTLYFREGRGITLKKGSSSTKGAKLTLNNSKCTAYDGCGDTDEMWEGITVEGAGNNYAQTPLTNTRHGQLVMQNNAIIEFAQIGVFSNGGGIVLATQSKFIDNRHGVKIHNYTPNNISKFVRCLFNTTDNLYNAKQTYVYKLVNLWNINRLKFLGTTFTNTSTNTVKWKNGWGIQGSNNSFIVDEYYQNGSAQACQFTNLFNAIASFNGNSLSVKNSVFNSCNSGVYASGTDDAIMIAKNEFRTDYAMSADPDGVYSNYGVYIDASTGFNVTENTFFSGNAGVVVNNSQSINGEGDYDSDQNSVYKNKFYTINNAYGKATSCLAHGENSNYLVDGNSSPNIFQHGEAGLEYKCNTYNGNDYNIAVVGTAEHHANIDQSQGSAYKPVGNAFNVRASTSWDFYANYTDVEQYQYHHYDFPSHALVKNYTEDIVKNVNSDNSVPDCPSIFGGGGTIGIGKTKLALDNLDNLAKEKQEDIQLIKDAGFTELYLSKVENLRSENYQETTQELLEASSYLSEEVLKVFMENTVERPVPKLMVLSKNSPLPNKLKSKIDDLNIPDVLKWYLWEMQDGTNPLEKKKEEFNSLLAERDLLLDRAINFTVQANLSEKTDSLIGYLKAKENFYSDKKLITLYTAKQDYTNLDAQLSKLEAYQSDLSAAQAERLSDYIQLKRIQSQMMQAPLNADTICKSNIPALQAIASKTTKEGNIAASLLTDIGLANYKPMYLLPDNNRAAKLTKARADYSNLSAQDLVTVYPNPVNQILHIEYFSMSPKGQIEIYDLKGRLVKTKSFNQQLGFAEVNVNDLNSGTYVLCLNGDKTHSTKFMVKH